MATAFAARDVLGNVLSGLSVQFSQPFSIGDTIKVCSKCFVTFSVYWELFFLYTWFLLFNFVIYQKQVVIQSQMHVNVRLSNAAVKMTRVSEAGGGR